MKRYFKAATLSVLSVGFLGFIVIGASFDNFDCGGISCKDKYKSTEKYTSDDHPSEYYYTKEEVEHAKFIHEIIELSK